MRRLATSRFAYLLLAFSLAGACGGEGDGGLIDGDPPPRDAARDAGGDAVVPADGGEDASPDGGDAAPPPRDAGPPGDAGPDGSTPTDATVPPDTGPPDDGAVPMDATPPTDATTPVDTAPPVDAALPEDLIVGRCTNDAGLDCLALGDPGATFTAHIPTGGWKLVQGTQGLYMLVFALRTWGIDPGDPASPASADNPMVDIQVHTDTGILAAEFSGRRPFSPSPASPRAVEDAGIPVILTVSASYIEGKILDGDATVVDRAGVTRTAHFRLVPYR